ncbi:hypothetical protein K469DRAFT_795136 [Zopfia rhizophila CBS 207.26]|uniref:Uncharacterized protein n=1 Tax=Zopfia rhizophila CBS 207.26 TaxID=1314779 RepID=A0A6A6ESQ6_9PEZI|nr:hypothetical protein K469DRAFT_795136 [Zopfia rhizophila CBS 207.26]
MESWEAPSHGVPLQVYARLERNEPSVWEKVRTAQLVPPTERGLEGESTDVREVLAALERGDDIAGGQAVSDGQDKLDSEDGRGEAEADVDDTAAVIHEISSSGMFALDAAPDIADQEKLRYVCGALGYDAGQEGQAGLAWVGSGEGGAKKGRSRISLYLAVKSLPTRLTRDFLLGLFRRCFRWAVEVRDRRKRAWRMGRERLGSSILSFRTSCTMESSIQSDAEVQAFRANLRSTDDANKFQTCMEMRDKLLERQTELEWLFSCIEEVMEEECPQYKGGEE